MLSRTRKVRFRTRRSLVTGVTDSPNNIPPFNKKISCFTIFSFMGGVIWGLNGLNIRRQVLPCNIQIYYISKLRLTSNQMSKKFVHCPSRTVPVVSTFHKHNSLPLKWVFNCSHLRRLRAPWHSTFVEEVSNARTYRWDRKNCFGLNSNRVKRESVFVWGIYSLGLPTLKSNGLGVCFKVDVA